MTCAAHAVFAMRRSRVGSRRFVQPELVQKLYRLFKLAAFFFFFFAVLVQTLQLPVWLRRVGRFGNQSFVSAKL